MSQYTLQDIPEEVIEESIFSLLRHNELLRLRRVSKWTRSLTDDYLLSSTRLQPSAFIYLTRLKYGQEEEFKRLSLESFLNTDPPGSGMHKQIPTSSFSLLWNEDTKSAEIFQDPLITEFLQKYAYRVVHLNVLATQFPLGENEFRFYESLPYLRSLRINRYQVCGKSLANFPESFRNLQKLEIRILEFIPPQPYRSTTSPQWELLKHCKNLEYYKPPAKSEWAVLEQILREKVHPEFRFFDMEYQHDRKILFQDIPLDERVFQNNPAMRSREFCRIFGELCEMAGNSKVNLINLPLNFLTHVKAIPLQLLAPQVISIRDMIRYNGPKVVFPNVTEIILTRLWSQRDLSMDLKECKIMLPKVRKLHIKWGQYAGGPMFLELVTQFPNLEDIVFETCEFEDNDFTGHGWCEEPPLLQIPKLKKLDLGCVRSGGIRTDITFIKVISQLRLREFRLTCKEPLTTTTRVGIEALLEGPFRETIEIFPFHSWSLADLSAEELQQLARKFPNNQSF